MARDTADTPVVLPETQDEIDMTPANDAGAGGAPFLVLQSGPHLGAGLRAAREFLGLSLEDVADATKIRPQYLTALEAFEIDKLPSRPFATGYVRAYARMLGVEEEQVLGRFRRDAPVGDNSLRAPVGVGKDRDPRVGLVATGLAIIVAAIVIWNVGQRIMAEREPDVTGAVVEAPQAASVAGPVSLGEALPAPPEATVPKAYVTPGLEPKDPNAPPVVKAASVALVPSDPRPFVAKGKVYGAADASAVVTLQVARSVSLVARGADGKVYFAQQLQEGEAYRPPMLAGLVIDVSAPDAVDVFVAGVLKGKLGQPITPLSVLAKDAPKPVEPVAAPAASAPATAAPVPAAPAPAAAASPAPTQNGLAQ